MLKQPLQKSPFTIMMPQEPLQAHFTLSFFDGIRKFQSIGFIYNSNNN